jgi:glucose/arabinose dehydrogenase
MADGKVAVCTRRGQIWTIDNAFTHPEKPAEWKVFAEYLHEPLGLAYKDGWLYAVQRPEVTRLKDEDGDGRADVFETVSDDWGVNGNYHEYTFGSRFDKDGNIWCVLCLTGSFTSDSMYRGWVLRVNENGKMTPTACGVRSPGGIGFNAEGDVFYTDNQGAWNGSSSLKWVKPGSFQGNPNGNIWFEYANGAIGDPPPHPDYTKDDRIEAARKKIPTFIPPAVVLPHGKVGNSPTGIEPDLSKGKFGPFAGQTFVGEQTHSKVHRVYLEQVKGIYQGAMFPFLRGFKSGNIGLLLTDDGVMFTGGSNRGWGAKGGQPYSFERVNWTGKTPFEIHEMRARKDGFELTFTEAINKETATDGAFSMEAFTYDYAKKYGSPEVDKVNPKVSVTSVADDGKSLLLKVEPMTKGHVHALKASGIKNGSGNGLLHADAYYTLNEIPD